MKKYTIKKAKFDGSAWFFVGITLVFTVLSFVNPDYVLTNTPATMADWQAPSVFMLMFMIFTALFQIKKVTPETDEKRGAPHA